MRRQEALDLIKEILVRQVVMPNWIAFDEVEPDKYGIIIKGDYNLQVINLLVQGKNLTVKEHDGALSIY